MVVEGKQTRFLLVVFYGCILIVAVAMLYRFTITSKLPTSPSGTNTCKVAHMAGGDFRYADADTCHRLGWLEGVFFVVPFLVVSTGLGAKYYLGFDLPKEGEKLLLKKEDE